MRVITFDDWDAVEDLDSQIGDFMEEHPNMKIHFTNFCTTAVRIEKSNGEPNPTDSLHFSTQVWYTED